MSAGPVVIEHPNRERASARLARALTAALLLGSALVALVITIGGWDETEGAKPVTLAYVVIYVVLALLVARWSRGVLPVAAALAVSLGIFAALATPGWFDRDAEGYSNPGLGAAVIGLLCLLLVLAQVALVLSALIAFRQRWNVEIERPRNRPASAEPAPA